VLTGALWVAAGVHAGMSALGDRLGWPLVVPPAPAFAAIYTAAVALGLNREVRGALWLGEERRIRCAVAVVLLARFETHPPRTFNPNSDRVAWLMQVGGLRGYRDRVPFPPFPPVAEALSHAANLFVGAWLSVWGFRQLWRRLLLGEWPRSWTNVALSVGVGLILSAEALLMLGLSGPNRFPGVETRAACFFAAYGAGIALLLQGERRAWLAFARRSFASALGALLLVGVGAGLGVVLSGSWVGAYGLWKLGDSRGSVLWTMAEVLREWGYGHYFGYGGWTCLVMYGRGEVLASWFGTLLLTALPLWAWKSLWDRWVGSTGRPSEPEPDRQV